ncbi:ribosome small subunit-dependent GTPase A [Mucilaginibacter rubeus]|uniref:Small ribosomal subunit biogenesis GTPase RsgA n=1 Tax=Mucilaginibacter rubeus TaxID=2027860 RepID=A0AAE6MM29_9SPHI|nr:MULTISPECIES: ribosome small subunit-dependent GTPase A [Mucilaginibacter]QEM08390.1 ribosome small subunit-dependent GTPase A [Mucilaginibacter rubeus]QEM19397.1 ribosome small subunit-dependent GTPase A [Mucilaginibacter gossypii]QTE44054.1 ribosome small subunit-dependent GTPase A [Mucilaginibacter rubeus]QTE50655.1 ribosome small subunit-dependent GTPase A [Mucilaginibacter rubeus]QTE60322.1 ribosome small subunit-dependent GTPase A [Mucilaginibacter rubeus]
MQGLITKSTGSWYQVQTPDGQKIDCRIKGKFRIKGITTTNPIAVGDVVDFEMEPDREDGVITNLHQRKNYIIRKAINLSKQAQIIAANLDQAILVVTLASPRTSLGFIDRFLVTAEAYDIPARLVFNKLDLFSDEGLEVLADYKAIYEDIGYPCFEVSAIEGTNISQVQDLLKDKVTLFSGHSGVGKSSLINALLPELDLRTHMVSDWSDKGMHTTTFAEMFELPQGGFIIDTPGIRELGVIDIEKQELGHFFPEMRERMNQCRFNNCRHINEPGCAVLEALEEGEITLSRYESYLSIYHGNDTRA